uniref:Vta1/callose synthase N-terminal domain-containing protein n=1 Tax=Polytomella parva TaxID=51329 RepID=A0A7S0VF18_9CHLO|mmetsp:Transcript_4967/g.9140  ORF Transcript_4967/g.9140 Transcript_4967/m.9140 type:complete len:509 (+) Transcript_4967:83-1609(+)
MSTIEEQKKLLLPLLQRAQEIQVAEPLVAYYCRLYAVEQGLQIPNRASEINSLLGSALSQLETDKKKIQLDNSTDKLYCEGFALKIFHNADKIDRAGRATENTAKAYYASSIFLEILNQFGPLPADIADKQKFAIWRATEIRKAIREGRPPCHPEVNPPSSLLPIEASLPSPPFAATDPSPTVEATPALTALPPNNDSSSSFPSLSSPISSLPISSSDLRSSSAVHPPPPDVVEPSTDSTLGANFRSINIDVLEKKTPAVSTLMTPGAAVLFFDSNYNVFVDAIIDKVLSASQFSITLPNGATVESYDYYVFPKLLEKDNVTVTTSDGRIVAAEIRYISFTLPMQVYVKTVEGDEFYVESHKVLSKVTSETSSLETQLASEAPSASEIVAGSSDNTAAVTLLPSLSLSTTQLSNITLTAPSTTSSTTYEFPPLSMPSLSASTPSLTANGYSTSSLIDIPGYPSVSTPSANTVPTVVAPLPPSPPPPPPSPPPFSLPPRTCLTIPAGPL